MIKKLLLFGYLVLLISLVSCNNRSEYERLVEQEYKAEAGNDSLFLGYHFGMTRDEFYEHSWDLNRKKIVREGNNNQSVRYEIDELKNRATMNFYPVFNSDSIYSMPVQYSYSGWAPWNRNLWADSLEKDVLNLYQERYNGRFKKMPHPEKDKMAYILIQGNKRISIHQMDDNRHVAVIYTDLDVLNRLAE